MKKSFAISFLFLATVIFMAHAVVPHHHHGRSSCFDASHCQDDEDFSADHDHSHGNSGYTFCHLLLEMVPETNDYKLKVAISDFQPLLFVVPQLLYLTNLDTELIFLLRDVFHQPLYDFIVVNSQGLRAPPIC